jgi:hypothetical protein
MTMNDEDRKHECAPEHASEVLGWINNRGGVAVWPSVNMSNLGASWSTPALTKEGEPTPKPTWQADSKPSQVITDPADIVVVMRKEVKRFHVAVRMGAQGFMLKLTDASARKLRAALDKAGDKASHHFDYETQEAVITMPASVILIVEYVGALER